MRLAVFGFLGHGVSFEGEIVPVDALSRPLSSCGSGGVEEQVVVVPGPVDCFPGLLPSGMFEEPECSPEFSHGVLFFSG